jgi:hypothetical protein
LVGDGLFVAGAEGAAAPSSDDVWEAVVSGD